MSCTRIRRSAKQVASDQVDQLMKHAERGEMYYGAHRIVTMIYSIEVLAAKMDWTDLQRKIARWSCGSTTETKG